MRRPIRLPKITKYRIAVTAEGSSVWPQMRTMRPYSRITMVEKPIQRAVVSDARGAESHGCRVLAMRPSFSTSRMNISSSRLTLLRMLTTSMPEGREPREQLIEILLLGDIGLERVLIDAAAAQSPAIPACRDSGARVLSTKVSVCSRRSRLPMRSRSMMLPLSMIAMLRHRLSASSR